MAFQKTYTVKGVSWKIKTGGHGWSWPPLLALATTWGATTIFDDTFSPDSISWAHEFCHVTNTNWIHYAFSFTIGRIWGDCYWKNQESMANLYGQAHKNDPDFLAIAADIRAALPASSATATLDHPVTPC